MDHNVKNHYITIPRFGDFYEKKIKTPDMPPSAEGGVFPFFCPRVVMLAVRITQ
jgi:hypothetical protein